MTTDEKIPRTRRALEEAIYTLLKTTRLSDISISQLCREAGIGRATFYRSYSQPADILIEQYSCFVRKFSDPQEGQNGPRRETLIRGLTAMKMTPERRQVCLNIFADATGGIHGYVIRPEIMGSILSEKLLPRAARYYSYILADVIRVWLEDGKETPEQIADMLIALADVACEAEKK